MFCAKASIFARIFFFEEPSRETRSTRLRAGYEGTIDQVCIHIFHCENYFERSGGRTGRDCRPNRRKTVSAPASARFQTGKAATAFFLPFGVSSILRMR